MASLLVFAPARRPLLYRQQRARWPVAANAGSLAQASAGAEAAWSLSFATRSASACLPDHAAPVMKVVVSVTKTAMTARHHSVRLPVTHVKGGFACPANERRSHQTAWRKHNFPQQRKLKTDLPAGIKFPCCSFAWTEGASHCIAIAGSALSPISKPLNAIFIGNVSVYEIPNNANANGNYLQYHPCR